MSTVFDLNADPKLPADVGLFLETLDDSSREWRDELGEVSEDAIVWQPFPGGHSIGAVLLHIAEVELWWIQEVCCGIPMTKEQLEETMRDQINQDAVDWPTPPRRPLSWYLDLLDRVRARTKEVLPKMGPMDEILKPRPTSEYSFSRRWILAHVVGHDSYHGGQAVFLRVLWEKTAGR